MIKDKQDGALDHEILNFINHSKKVNNIINLAWFNQDWIDQNYIDKVNQNIVFTANNTPLEIDSLLSKQS